MLWTDAKVGN